MKRSVKMMVAAMVVAATTLSTAVLPVSAEEQTTLTTAESDPNFQLKAYMFCNPDLMAAFGSDYGKYYEHYQNYGIAEQRKATFQAGEGFDEQTLGSFTTLYDVTEDRAINVELAASKINGMVIQPGESFSFSDAVGKRSSANGYVVAPSFAGGKVVSGIGGGICQVSSTLYAAMLVSGIPATQHYIHSLPVDYIPRGLDAAIAKGYKDLKFVNPFDYPITLQATTVDGKVIVSITK